jgi:glycosyltransferase involved in cell wall biosynthesis
MTLRIAMFSWESMHSIAIGGLAPHASELAAALHRRGHEVHVFTRMGEGQSRYDVADGVHYHRCPFEPHTDFLTMIRRMNDSFIWHFAETEHHLGRAFDVVHGHDWLAVDSIRQARNRHGRPSVLTIHSTEYGRCGNCLWDDPMSRNIRDLEWEGSYIANRVICVSQALAREVQQQYSVPADKVHPVYNGVHARNFDAPVNVSEVRRKHRIGLDDPCVLFAGRMTWQKGPDLLVEAVPAVLDCHPDTKIVFAGDGDMRAGLETRAQSMGIASSTRFLGHRNGLDLISLFKTTDVVCVPSRNEPFGIVILEAWSAMKPVVATRTGGPEEFVEHEINGLKVTPDSASISAGLCDIFSDRVSLEEMGRNGRREAESRFSWDSAAEQTERVYDAALERGNGKVNGPGATNGDAGNMGRERTTSKSDASGGGVKTAARTGITTALSATARPTEEEIRQRAYAIYLARNGAPGEPMADWLQAESELQAERQRAQERSSTRKNG